MTHKQTSFFDASDGVRLAIHEVGEGRPLLLLHGYFSNASTNWITYGHAALLAQGGFRVIMPDLRAHGDSGKPHHVGAYPPDILARDALEIVTWLGLGDYDLGGYSLGARTVARMLASGVRPSRVIVSGMGLEGLTDTGKRAAHFRRIFDGLGTHPRGSPEYMAEAFLKTTKGDAIALAHLLDSFVDTPLETIRSWSLPVQVLIGVDDNDNGSAEALADALANATLTRVPGNHMSAVTKPDLGAAMLAFLNEKGR